MNDNSSSNWRAEEIGFTMLWITSLPTLPSGTTTASVSSQESRELTWNIQFPQGAKHQNKSIVKNGWWSIEVMMVNRGFPILNPEIGDTIFVDLGSPHRYVRQKKVKHDSKRKRTFVPAKCISFCLLGQPSPVPWNCSKQSKQYWYHQNQCFSSTLGVLAVRKFGLGSCCWKLGA